jgi:hypothetical protein
VCILTAPLSCPVCCSSSTAGEVVVMWLANSFSADRVVAFSTGPRVIATRSLASAGGPSVRREDPLHPHALLFPPRPPIPPSTPPSVADHRGRLLALCDAPWCRLSFYSSSAWCWTTWMPTAVWMLCSRTRSAWSGLSTPRGRQAHASQWYVLGPPRFPSSSRAFDAVLAEI